MNVQDRIAIVRAACAAFTALVLSIVIALTSLPCHAAETGDWLQVHLVSAHPAHIRNGQELHDATPGVGWLHRHDDLFSSLGVMRNSYARTAGYAAIGWQPEIVPGVRAGLFAGVTHHYPYREGRPFVFGGAVFSIEGDRVGMHLTLLPPVQNVSGGAVAVSVSWRF